MKEEFEKAMAEQIDKTHWDSWSYEVGAHWAYEWLTNEHHQFALHRSWVNKCKNIEAKLAIAVKKIESIAHWTKKTHPDFFNDRIQDICDSALEEINKTGG